MYKAPRTEAGPTGVNVDDVIPFSATDRVKLSYHLTASPSSRERTMRGSILAGIGTRSSPRDAVW